ncbi:hypothetical protein HanXRQr2_Chr15g0707811 [Helianthus annuus]|uniref:Uncharacterized protein n=1 Tax=Helianthus annuus TaxID=4232 RepID=A0A9K3H5S0_HELAN|nr:hypothetical protein HanXRQr2_Chr15g0707811 [Helianthus annuus]
MWALKRSSLQSRPIFGRKKKSREIKILFLNKVMELVPKSWCSILLSLHQSFSTHKDG